MNLTLKTASGRPLPDRENPYTARMNAIPVSTIELNPEGEANAAVIWLHGLGADGNDFVPIVPELRLPATLKIRFVFPNAPVQPVTLNGGASMRAWYDIVSLDFKNRGDEKGIRASQAMIDTLIAREHARGLAHARIVLAGFSQGGVIALQTGLRHAQKLGGVIALSTYLSCQDSLTAEATSANQSTKILMVHGMRDAVIPVSVAEQSQQVLKAAGYDVQWKTYPMEHSVCAEEVGDIARFLREVLG
jgi:phospholipase/carboxylesterase